MNVNSNSTFYGVLFAPAASVNFDYKNVFGAVVGGKAILNSGGEVHYDPRLGQNCKASP